MHVFDIITAALALLFVIVGLYRGFVEEALRLIGIVAAFFTGLALYRVMATHLTFLKLSGAVLSVVSFLIIFCAALLVIILLGMLVKKIIHLTVLGWVDRLCGGVLGFLKAFFLVWIAVTVIASLPFGAIRRWFEPSKSYSFFMAISPTLKIHGMTPAAGPVQNILKANPIPAIVNAYKALDSSSRKADSLSGSLKKKTQSSAAKHK
jgi:membrane protein required for colicin V production